MKFQVSNLGNPFFQMAEPREVMLGDVPLGVNFLLNGRTYTRLADGRIKTQRGVTSPKIPDITTIVTV